MRLFTLAILVLFTQLCALEVPSHGGSLKATQTFTSTASAAKATDSEPFTYVTFDAIDFSTLQRAIHGSDLTKVRTLVDANPGEVNARNDVKGWSAIYEAARCGQLEILTYLCDTSNADIDITSKRGGTPAMAAAWFDKPECVKYLVEAGCSTSISNLADDTLYTIAKRRCSSVVPWLEAQGITE